MQIDPKAVNFSSCKVLVVGDAMLDKYWLGNTSRISPEAPVPVVHLQDIENRLGGAANVAYNIASLEANAVLQYYYGDDTNGKTLQAMLGNSRIEACGIKLEAHPTITKLRVLSRGQQLIRIDQEQSYDNVSTDIATSFVDIFKSNLENVDIVILSDYAKGTLAGIQKLIKLARKANVPVVIDPKNKDLNIYRGANIITPNFNEFQEMVGICETEETIIAKAKKALHDYELGSLVVTRGSRGVTVIEKDATELTIPAFSSEVYDVTGAGDTVISTLALALAAGNDVKTSAYIANKAAGLVVSKIGTAAVTTAELQSMLQRNCSLSKGAIAVDSLKEVVKTRRNLGERIVLVNGCYDVLHYGHIRYLNKARSFGDRLIVAINDDAYIRKRKGSNRPINSLNERMEMLAALDCVDWVVSFSEDTPGNIVKAINPDILVKNGTAFKSINDIPENEGAAYIISSGGEVYLVDETTGISSTKLVKQCKTSEKAMSEGGNVII